MAANTLTLWPILNRTMTSRFFYAFLATLIFSFGVQGQDSDKMFSADSIFIYKDFTVGGTTANLWHNHKDLDSTNNQKTKLNKEETIEIVDIFKKAKRKKLFQQKYGRGICYILIYKSVHKSISIIYSSQEIGFVDNLDTMKRWIVNDTTDKRRLYEIIRKNWP
jgi:hypothetical protein